MRLVFAGTPEAAIPTLNALVDAGHTIAGVITREDAPVGRKRVLTPSPIAVRAAELGLNVRKVNRLDENDVAWVTQLAPDVGVVVAYGGLLKPDMLAAPTLGWINLHFSLLPKWRGAAPVQRALMAGEQELGLSVFRLVTALDAGDLLTTDTHTVPLGTTAQEALELLADQGTSLVLAALETLATNPAAGTPQTGTHSYAHKLTRDDGKLSPEWDTQRFIAHWAGVTPAPGAHLIEGGTPLKVHRLTSSVYAPEHPAGTVTMHEQHTLLHLHDGTVQLDRVQPAGKAAMDGAAWLRGRNGTTQLT